MDKTEVQLAEFKMFEKSANTMPAVGTSSATNPLLEDATEKESVVGGNTQSKSVVGDDTDSMSVEVKDTDRKGTAVEESVVKVATEESEETMKTNTIGEESTEETIVETSTKAVEEKGAKEIVVETQTEKTLIEGTQLKETQVEEIGVKVMEVQDTFVEKGEKTVAVMRTEKIEVEETGADEEPIYFVEQAKKKTAAQKRLSAPVYSYGLWVTVGIIGILLALLVSSLFQPQPPPKQLEEPLVIFRREVEKVQNQFPSQRRELWRRSRIHLERHLQTAHPSEPVSLILTAGTKAEKTLRCLAQCLASAFSFALNASVLNIEGVSKASLDSNQVKLEIDGQLRRAFEGDQPVAVIHRFEELPAGSTLIFYRYCDHENAAYKNVSLFFTVLLGGEKELQTNLTLSAVEEMVDDHLRSKFLFSDQPTAFDTMDLDKFSGLWSRISHLILPVVEEKTMELEGCGETERNQSPS